MLPEINSVSEDAKKEAWKSTTNDISKISVPKERQALKNIDEKFWMNVADGIASFSSSLSITKRCLFLSLTNKKQTPAL